MISANHHYHMNRMLLRIFTLVLYLTLAAFTFSFIYLRSSGYQLALVEERRPHGSIHTKHSDSTLVCSIGRRKGQRTARQFKPRVTAFFHQSQTQSQNQKAAFTDRSQWLSSLFTPQWFEQSKVCSFD